MGAVGAGNAGDVVAAAGAVKLSLQLLYLLKEELLLLLALAFYAALKAKPVGFT